MKQALVAYTPLAGALGFPLIVLVVLQKAGIPAAVLTAVILSTVWFVTMLRTAEMPGHH
jgi:cytochrome c oxidase subunit IV